MRPQDVTRQQYVDYFTKRLACKLDAELETMIAAGHGLDHIYAGKSIKIHRLIRVAFERGIRYGVGKVWEAHQPITLRDT